MRNQAFAQAVAILGYSLHVQQSCELKPPGIASSAMRLKVHEHAHACECAAHRASIATAPNAGMWSTLLPVLACAVCPACLTTYAKLFSVLGVGFGLSEFQHLVILGVAIGGSISVSAWRSWRTRRAWPIAIALSGSTLVVTGHFAGDLYVVEWVGVLLLLVGGLTEHFRLRRQQASLVPSAA
jgi:hypothetical protein